MIYDRADRRIIHGGILDLFFLALCVLIPTLMRLGWLGGRGSVGNWAGVELYMPFEVRIREWGGRSQI